MSNIKVSVNIPASIEETVKASGTITKYTYTVSWKKEDLSENGKPAITLEWTKPLIDIQYQWYTDCGTNRAFVADWYAPVLSKISCGAPLHCFYNDAGRNRYTIALDACLTEVARGFGVREENAELKCCVTVPLDPTGVTEAYTFTLWLDETDSPYEDAIRRVVTWWEEKHEPMTVPSIAKDPLYSCWYSLHQDVYEDIVRDECARAAKLGMKTVIIDDGWQTDDSNRGYGYCGDWQVATSKISDMRKLVDDIHALGMKVLIWYSVPFIGKFAAAAERFANMTLGSIDSLDCSTLDPRYPEVRSYLIETYVNAVRDWDLDGLKLDFIDSFRMTEESPLFREGMDTPVLEDAVHTLMVDVMKALKAIRSDILIEFRQRYIGPAMREYGNLFRVGDCPNTTSTNRIGTVDLRLTSGLTAVHSDMLMWHASDRVENAVCQIENCMFSTVQFSAKLADMTEEHTKAIRFWTQFLQEEKSLLQDAPIYAESPQMLYPVVHTEQNGRAAYACYQRGHLIDLPASRLDDLWLVNANSGSELLLRTDVPVSFKAEIYNCMGDLQRTETITLNGLTVLSVPECGLVRLTK